MDSVRIVANPGVEVVNYINHHLATEQNWNRSENEYVRWRDGYDGLNVFVAFDNATNDPIGSISIAKHNSLNGDPEDDFYFIGSVYVKENYRSTGLGKRLCEAAMNSANGTNVGLNARAAMTPFYEHKFGFSFYTGSFCIQARLDTDKMHPNGEIDCKDYHILAISEIDFEKVAAYDKEISQRDRKRYLKLWFSAKGAISKVAVDPKTGKVVGIICALPQIRNRLAVGPFYAENKEIATILMHKLLAIENLKSYEQVWFRFPSANEDALPMLKSIIDGEFEQIQAGQVHFNKKFIDYEKSRVFSVLEANHNIV